MKETMTKKQWFWRIGFYAMGTLSLSCGVTLSTKAGIGIACISSVPFAVSNAFDISFPKAMFVLNMICVAVQFAIKGKRRQWRDLFQVPYSFVFSSCLSWFGSLFTFHFEALWQNLLLVLLATVMNGIGMYFIVSMNFVPNAPDGMIHALSSKYKKGLGLMKNIVDGVSVALSTAVDLIFTGQFNSVGIGTLCFMFGVGRVVALEERLFGTKVLEMAGLMPQEAER